MKKPTILVIPWLALSLQGQTVTPVLVSSQGGYNSAAAGSISWSIGEPVSDTRSSTTHITTLGFHQSELNVQTLIAEQAGAEGLLVFPNPVRDFVTVNLEGLKPDTYLLQLTDVRGRLISSGSVSTSLGKATQKLNLDGLAEGTYFVRVSSESFFKSVQIIKTH